MAGGRAETRQYPQWGEADSTRHVFTNGCDVNTVTVAREYFLPEYPKEILEMGLR